jgi:hypothetical protein
MMAAASILAADDPKSEAELKRKESQAALEAVFTKHAVVSIQNDGITIQLYSQSNSLLPKAAMLSEEVRNQVDCFIIHDLEISDASLKAIISFPNVDDLYLNDMKKWRSGFEPLMTGLPKLKSVWAQQMGLTNKELAIICKAKRLEYLMVGKNKFTPGACKLLVELDELYQLNLSGNDLADEDILNLKDKQSLGLVWLDDTNVTEKGVDALKSTLSPKCFVFWSPKEQK